MPEPGAPAAVRGLAASAALADFGGAVLFAEDFTGAAFADCALAGAAWALSTFADAAFADCAFTGEALAPSAFAGARFAVSAFTAELFAVTGLPAAGDAGSGADGALFALRLPKIRDFFLFSFVSTIAGALLVPSAGSRATPPGNVLERLSAPG